MTTTAFQIADLSVMPGERAAGSFVVGNRGDGTPLGVPFIVTRGRHEGPILCLDAASHGDEPEGSLAIVELMRNLDPEHLSGIVVGVPMLNVPAGELNQRAASPSYEIFVYDMNRIMPGRAKSSVTMRLARAYWDGIASRSDCVISIHGGGLRQYRTPRIIIQKELPASLALAKSMGGAWTVLQENVPEAGSTEKACAELGIPCVLLECGGGPGRMPEQLRENVDLIIQGLTNAMRHLGMVNGGANGATEWTMIEGGHTVWAQHGGLLSPYPAFKLNERVAKDTPLFDIFTLQGELAETIVAPWDGVVLGFKSTVYVQPGDIVCSIGRFREVIL
jgi:predicted deacylase